MIACDVSPVAMFQFPVAIPDIIFIFVICRSQDLTLSSTKPGKGVPPNFCLCVASLGAERGVNEARSKKRYIDNIMCSPILNTINSVYLSGKLNIKFKHFSLWQNVPPYLFSQYLVYTCNLYILNKTEVIKSSMVINGINQ